VHLAKPRLAGGALSFGGSGRSTKQKGYPEDGAVTIAASIETALVLVRFRARCPALTQRESTARF